MTKWLTDTPASSRFPVYTRSNASDVLPDPISPLAATLSWRPGVMEGWRDGNVNNGAFSMDELTAEGINPTCGFFNGYFYVNASVVRVMGERSGAGAAALSGPEQIAVVGARVVLARLDAPDAPLPPALLDEARQTVARVDAAATDGYARQAAINAAVGLYWEAGLDTEADQLLVAELEKSKSPYYFMLDLAESAKKAGREDEAVQWLAKAYAGATGPATRFQWGYSYLVGLLEMTPEDATRIEQVGLAVLGELDDSPDAFYQRTRMRLEQLSAKLLEWGKTDGHGAVVERLRERTGEICRGLPAGDAGRASCENFLRPAA